MYFFVVKMYKFGLVGKLVYFEMCSFLKKRTKKLLSGYRGKISRKLKDADSVTNACIRGTCALILERSEGSWHPS